MKKPTPDSSRTTNDGADNAEVSVPSERARQSRRKLIQILATGGVVTSARLVPSNWAKPVVETVTLPAHAQTTEEDRGPGACRLGVNLNEEREDLGASAVPDENYRNTNDLSRSIVDRLKGVGEEVLNQLVGEAWADETPELCFAFTGCFWIEFKCNSKNGQLCFYYFDELLTDDSAADDEDSPPVVKRCIPFGEDGYAEWGGVSFQVEIFNRDEAMLTITGCCTEPYEADLRRGWQCPDTDLGDSALSGIPCR